MNLLKKLKKTERGQALVEFAIVSIVLLLILFLIIEVSRVLWAWITVQNAAREGARYAVTGSVESDCELDAPPCDDPRVQSIIDVVEENLVGLRLNDDPDATYEDDFAYFIEIYGVDDTGVLQEDFAGVAQQPMAVRVVYNVPIIVPILSDIAENIPVMGQVVENNERFGSQGGIDTGNPLAPELPSVPTVGPTPTNTPTPSPTSTATPTNTPPGYVAPPNTSTPTYTPTATPIRCNVQFVNSPYEEGDSIIQVTGDIGTTVTAYDLSAGGTTLASGTIENVGTDTACEGLLQLIASPILIENHVILIESSDGSFTTEIVAGGVAVSTSTPTATLEPTDTPSPTPSSTPSSTPTATPIGAFLLVSPECASGPDIEFLIRGFNWDDSRDIDIYYDGVLDATIPRGHGGSFTQNRQKFGQTDGTHTITAESGNGANEVIVSTTIDLPCPNVTPTPTMPVTPTPEPADLIVVGAPSLASSPPIIAYQPVSFTVVISNVGELDVESQFFVDLYFDPPDSAVQDAGIDVAYSSAYQALSGIEAGASNVLTITAPFGFTGVITDPRQIYSMVDSITQIQEQIETNNVSTKTEVLVTPAPTPTASPTPDPTSDDVISGVVQILLSRWVPQPRAYVFLVEDDGLTQTVIRRTSADLSSAAYAFDNVASPPAGTTYQTVACLEVDGKMYVGSRINLTPPNQLAYLYMLASATGCPYLN